LQHEASSNDSDQDADGELTPLPKKGDAPSSIEVDAATLASAIREQQALPLTSDEAEQMARAIETSPDDEALLANTLAAVQLLVDRLESTVLDRNDG
jgi:Arc/MetJ family transcription regulator